MVTNIKYGGNNTIETQYRIPPVSANPLPFCAHPRVLKSAASPTATICGISNAVARAAPTCSLPSVLETLVVKYDTRYTK